MSDRLPAPQVFESESIVERASATPARRHVVNEARRATRDATSDRVPRTLGELQTWMLDAITEHADAGVDAVVTAGPRLDPVGRLAVYQSGYFARLVECLADDYPVMAASLGGERFERVAHAYVHRHPSTSPNLNAFGRHMPAFCKIADELSLRERAFTSDLAALEWAIVEVIHGRAAAPLDPATLQSLPVEAWAEARFVPSGAVRLLRFEHPVNAFFQAYRTTGSCPEIPAAQGSATVVYRKAATVWRMDLTPAMTRVLGALLDGATIADALSRMGADESDPELLAEAERSVMIWFREWVDGAMFAGISFEPT